MEKDKIRVASFGDQVVTDIQDTYEFNNSLIKDNMKSRWDAIAVIEEFSQVDKAFEKGRKARLVPHAEMFWGSQYFYDREYESNNLLRNYWIKKTEMAARYAIPFLKNIDRML